MRKWTRAWCTSAMVAGMLITGSGCATYTAKTDVIVQEYRSGMTDAAIAKLDQRVTRGGKDTLLNLTEAARMKMIDGQLDGSRAYLSEAAESMIEIKEGAVFSIKGGTAGLFASTLGNDSAIPYKLPGYELIMAFQYSALVDLLLGDRDAAAVEIRRAVYFQDEIAGEYEKEIESARKDAAEGKNADHFKAVAGKYPDMGPVLGRVKSSFQNAYAWYTAGLIYEINNDPGNAYIAYKKAWELIPHNPVVQRDLVRLSAVENSEEHRDFKEKFGIDDPTSGGGDAEIIVFFEENQISRRQSMKILLPLPVALGGPQSLLFPYYQDGPYRPATIQVSIDNIARGQLEPLCYMQSLAYHDLQERMPGIIARNITRAISRGALHGAMRRSDNDYVKLASLIVQLGTVVAEEADTRAWSTLPMAVQIYRRSLPAGRSDIRIENVANGLSIPITVDLAQGEKRLIWAADIMNAGSIGMVSLNRETGPGPFAKNKGILDSVAFGIARNEPAFKQTAPLVPPAPAQPATPAADTAPQATPPVTPVPLVPGPPTHAATSGGRALQPGQLQPGATHTDRAGQTPTPVGAGAGDAEDTPPPRFGIF